MLNFKRRSGCLLIFLFIVVANFNGGTAAYAKDSADDTPDDPRVSLGTAGVAHRDTARLSVTVGASAPTRARTQQGNDAAPQTKDHDVKEVAKATDLCYYSVRSSAATIAAGYDPLKGTLSLAKCPVQSNLPGLPDGVRYVTHEVWTLNGEVPVAPPPPDPAVLAQSVASELTVPVPVVHVGAVGVRVAVKVPVWLWVDEQAALTASVSAGGLTVRARAVLTSTEWSMGEPVGDPDVGGSSRVASFFCGGAGSAAGVGVDRSVVPACGYTYVWRSDVGRTGGSGVWPVNVVAHWTLSWEATNGARGTIALQAAAASSVAVGEWRVALVDGGGTR